jgi:hypothetical protein
MTTIDQSPDRYEDQDNGHDQDTQGWSCLSGVGYFEELIVQGTIEEEKV